MSSADRILLDTHVLVWWKADSARLSRAAIDAISAAPAILISPFTCWEVAMLAVKQRLKLNRSTVAWIHDVLAEPRSELADLTASTAVAAAELPDFHGDPADRFIVATAEALGVPLLTKDGLIHRFAANRPTLDVIW